MWAGAMPGGQEASGRVGVSERRAGREVNSAAAAAAEHISIYSHELAGGEVRR